MIIIIIHTMTELNNLRKGDRAIVVQYQNETPLTNHLRILGLVPGTELSVRNPAPFGGIVQIDFRGQSFGLRNQDMQQVKVQKIVML